MRRGWPLRSHECRRRCSRCAPVSSFAISGDDDADSICFAHVVVVAACPTWGCFGAFAFFTREDDISATANADPQRRFRTMFGCVRQLNESLHSPLAI